MLIVPYWQVLSELHEQIVLISLTPTHAALYFVSSSLWNLE